MGSDPEARHHLIGDEAHAPRTGRFRECREKVGVGRHAAHVASDNFHDDRTDPLTLSVKQVPQCRGIVVGQDPGQAGQFGRYARRTRMAARECAGTGLDEQAVTVSMVAAGELDQPIPSRHGPGQPDGTQGGFGARAHEADPFDARDAFDQSSSELGLAGSGSPEAQAVTRRPHHCGHDIRIRVAEERCSPGTDTVQVAGSIDTPDLGSAPARDEHGNPADGMVGPNRGVDPSDQDGAGLFHQIGIGHRRLHTGFSALSWSSAIIMHPFPEPRAMPVPPAQRPEWAVEVVDVSKSYGHNPALQEASFGIRPGEIFGLLGPNGAGKTTLVEILLGIKHRDRGEVRILGVDPETAPRQIRELICGQLQISPFPDKIRVEELLHLFATLYPHPRPVDELLALVGLDPKRQEFYERLSGGQKQRLALALALVGDTDLIVLDEPTTGLDAKIRHELHDIILELSRMGKTLLLTTHYIEEAEKLCTRVAILFGGRIRAVDTPKALVERFTDGQHLEVRLNRGFSPEEEIDLKRRFQFAPVSGSNSPDYRFHGEQGERLLVDLVLDLTPRGIGLEEARIRRPSLEEAYLTLTGSRIEP